MADKQYLYFKKVFFIAPKIDSHPLPVSSERPRTPIPTSSVGTEQPRYPGITRGVSELNGDCQSCYTIWDFVGHRVQHPETNWSGGGSLPKSGFKPQPLNPECSVFTTDRAPRPLHPAAHLTIKALMIDTVTVVRDGTGR